MSQFPSPADSASFSPGSGFQTSPKSTSKLYPDLSTADPEEDDILAALGAPPPRSKRPPRPPPPRSQSLPSGCEPPQSPHDSESQSLPPSHAPYSKSNSERDFYVPSPLHPHEVRWFYQEPGKYWQPFNGYDSLVLEDCYRLLQADEGCSASHEVAVLGDMYVVNLTDKTCKPVYWAGRLPTQCAAEFSCISISCAEFTEHTKLIVLPINVVGGIKVSMQIPCVP